MLSVVRFLGANVMRKLFYTLVIGVITLTIMSCSSSTTAYRSLQMPAGAYVADFSSQGTSNGNVWFYPTTGTGVATTLPASQTSWQPTSIAFNGAQAYVAANAANLWVYQVGATGALSGGVDAVPSNEISNWLPIFVAFNNSFGYVVSPQSVSMFSPGSNGLLTYVESIPAPTTPTGVDSGAVWVSNSIGFNGNYAYVTGVFINNASITGGVSVYSVDQTNGQLTYESTLSMTVPSTIITSIAFNGGYAYLGNITIANSAVSGSITVYQVANTGALASTATQTITNPVPSTNSFWLPTSITFSNGTAYVTNTYSFTINTSNPALPLVNSQASDVSAFAVSGSNLTYTGTIIPQAGVNAYWGVTQVSFYEPIATGGNLISSIDTATLTINTSTFTSGTPSATFTLTNNGTGSVYNINVQPSLPVVLESSNCPANLGAAQTCNVTIALTTSNAANTTESSGISPYSITYYNGSSESLAIPVGYIIESWRGSMFITESTTTGAISYTGYESGVLSADAYCQNDVNNPHNGYTYKAVISDDSSRSPSTTSWTLYPSESYVSVIESVYNQLVLTTTASAVFPTNPNNCISLNCAIDTPLNDPLTWNGLVLDTTTTSNTCNGWTSQQGTDLGTASLIESSALLGIIVGQQQSACETPHPIMCAAQ